MNAHLNNTFHKHNNSSIESLISYSFIIICFLLYQCDSISIISQKKNIYVPINQSFNFGVSLSKQNAQLIPSSVNIIYSISNFNGTNSNYFDFFYLTQTDITCYSNVINNQSYLFPCPFLTNNYALTRINSINQLQFIKPTQINKLQNGDFTFIIDNTKFPFPYGAFPYTDLNVNVKTYLEINISSEYQSLAMRLISINVTVFVIFVVVILCLVIKEKKLNKKWMGKNKIILSIKIMFSFLKVMKINRIMIIIMKNTNIHKVNKIITIIHNQPIKITNVRFHHYYKVIKDSLELSIVNNLSCRKNNQNKLSYDNIIYVFINSIYFMYLLTLPLIYNNRIDKIFTSYIIDIMQKICKQQQNNKNILNPLKQITKQIARKICNLTHNQFETAYYKKYKSSFSQSKKYTVISSIFLISKLTHQVKLISLSCGTKSIPYQLYKQHKSFILKDTHAEILSIKSFRVWLIEEIQNYMINIKQSGDGYIKYDQKRNKYEINKDKYQLWMYSSENLCGDCSILKNTNNNTNNCNNSNCNSSNNSNQINSKNNYNQHNTSSTSNTSSLFSGAKPLKYFNIPPIKLQPISQHQKYILRTKPGRNDLPLHKKSLILSCSDKIGLYNLIGIQGKYLFKYVKPIYIDKIVVNRITITQKNKQENMNNEQQQIQQNNIKNGVDFVYRLSKITNIKQQLIYRKILNIIINQKQQPISYQFQHNRPQIICINILQQIKKQQKQGIQISYIASYNHKKNKNSNNNNNLINNHNNTICQCQWISGKTGLPQGVSLNNYMNKNKNSIFTKSKLINRIKLISQKYFNKEEDQETFKYTAIKQRIKKLFNIWTDDFKKQ